MAQRISVEEVKLVFCGSKSHPSLELAYARVGGCITAEKSKIAPENGQILEKAQQFRRSIRRQAKSQPAEDI